MTSRPASVQARAIAKPITPAPMTTVSMSVAIAADLSSRARAMRLPQVLPGSEVHELLSHSCTNHAAASTIRYASTIGHAKRTCARDNRQVLNPKLCDWHEP
jgi:hypothetical protein